MAGLGGAVLSVSSRAWSHNQTVTLIVGYPPGGATDLLARTLAENLQKQLGATVIVMNKPGAGGRIAAEYVKNAKPDGMTLLFTTSSLLVIYPHIYQNLSYDPLRDFAPVSIAARSVLCLSVGPSVPSSVRTVADYVAWVKANPQMATFGTVSGTAPHFVGLLFSRAAGLDLKLVPYKGGAQAMTDLMGGHIPVTVSAVSEAQAFHAEGRIRTLATFGPQRPKVLTEVPTMIELGYKELSFQTWIGIVAPVATPPSVVHRLSAATEQALKNELVIANVTKLGMEPGAVTPEQFTSIMKADLDMFRRSVEITGFKAED